MKRTHLLPPATVLGLALLAAPAALAQRGGMSPDDAPSRSATPQGRATAEADRMHKGNGTQGGPADLLRMAQTAMRQGQTVQANELLERAETRLLTGADPSKPAGGEPARHVSEARRALMGRDRAEAMRHTNLAIATVGGGAEATGSDAGRPGMVDSGMGTVSGGGRGAVVRDGGTGGASISRAEGIVLAQSGGTGSGGTGRGSPAPTGLPPGDSLPGWSGPRGGAAGGWGGASPAPAPQATTPGGLAADSALGANARGGGMNSGAPNILSGPGSASMTGGEPARVGGAPPGDTSRAPGSSGIGGAGVGTSGVGGPIR